MKIENLNISYPSGTVYKDFSAEFEDRAITLILGSSGCGKTTLLHALALQAGKRDRVSFVFQEPRLIPWLSVRHNLLLALQNCELSHLDKERRIDRYLDLVGLLSRSGERPEKLSGGERQRAAIARAFANSAPVLFMDEPFQSQDHATKRQLITLVKDLHSIESRTIIAVTHNLDEMELYGDNLLLLSGRPAEVSFQAKNTSESRYRIKSIFTVTET